MSRRALIAPAALLAALLWACAPAAPPTPAPTPTATPTLDEYVGALCLFQYDVDRASVRAEYGRDALPAFTAHVERLERLAPPLGWEEYHAVALDAWRVMERRMRERSDERFFVLGYYSEIARKDDGLYYLGLWTMLSEENRARLYRVCFGQEG